MLSELKAKILIIALILLAIITVPIRAETEPNQSMETAETITPGVVNGSLSEVDVMDWYRIEGIQPGQGIVIQGEAYTSLPFGAILEAKIMKPESTLLDYRIVDAPGLFTLRAATNSSQQNYTYFILVEGDDVITYTLNVSILDYSDADYGTDVGDSPETAAPIGAGAIKGYLYGDDALDYYVYSGLESGQELSITSTFTPETENDEMWTINGVLLYNESMGRLIDANPLDATRTISYVASNIDLDTYIIEVSAFHSFSYELTVEVNNIYDAGSGGDVGDSFKSAYMVDAVMVEGHLGPTGDSWKYQSSDESDMYKVDLEAGETLSIQVESESSLEAEVFIYNSAFKLVASDDAPRAGEAFTVSYLSNMGGTYYVLVSPQLGYGGYTLDIVVTPLTGVIRLQVEDETGSPVDDAVIESILVPKDQRDLSGTTNSSGVVVFEELLFGHYTFNVTKKMFSSDTVDVEVSLSHAYDKTVTLTDMGTENGDGGEWIPGFPVESIILVLLGLTIIYWSRNR